MKVFTKDLIGKPLDWAVESLEIVRMRAAGEHVKDWWVEERQKTPSPYSTDPLWGWPIIERELLAPSPLLDHACNLVMWECRNWKGDGADFYGPTSLVAAMRCYVASVMGNEVEIPEGLA